MTATRMPLATLGWLGGARSLGWCGIAVVCTALLAGCGGVAASHPAPGNVAVAQSKAETVRSSLEAQANPWSVATGPVVDSAAVATCANLRGSSDRGEAMAVVASAVSEYPDPANGKPSVTVDQAMVLQKTLVSVYCPELGVS